MVSLGWAARSPESLVPDERSRLQREMARLAPMDDAMRRSIGSQQNGLEPDISALQAAAKAQQDAKHAPVTNKRPRQVSFSMHQQGAEGSSSEAGPSDLRKHPPQNPQQRSYDASQQVHTANPRSPSPHLGRTPSPISMENMPSVGTLAEQARDFEQQQALARSLQHQSRTMMNSAPRTPGPPPPEGPPWQFGDLLGVPRELHLPSHPQSHASGSATMSKSDSAFERATADARSQLTAQIQSLQNQSPNGVRTPGTEAQIHQLRRLQGRLAQQNTSRSPTMPETPPRSDIVVNAAHLRTPGSSGTSQSNAFHFMGPPYDSSPSNCHFEPHVAVPLTNHHLNENDNERGQYQGSGAVTTSSAPMSMPVFSGQQQHLPNHPNMQNIASSGFAHHGDPFDGLAPLLVHQDPNYAATSGIDFSFGQDPRLLPP
ncbi:hypothetical protein IE81DRAFT_124632 [Ceraceosorus guamensis]|uniref:Uncharacterized protein n=1 Tax=Ceraceosorus guamensis TaxID=1522189 RepID=A0A316W4D3_9BASI|nr:hypothetical protein IE81DRAFT_124632 [Ceraceosorus guamensis]PWN42485.1 hypothetical protein IE81DRAFT_124632 [Ceraceosorus guamensis]